MEKECKVTLARKKRKKILGSLGYNDTLVLEESKMIVTRGCRKRDTTMPAI